MPQKSATITPNLVGPRHKIAKIAAAANVDIATYEVVNAEHSHAVAEKAVALVRDGRAEML